MLNFLKNYSGDFLIDPDAVKYSYQELNREIVTLEEQTFKNLKNLKITILSEYGFHSIAAFFALMKLNCEICPLAPNQSEYEEKIVLFQPDYVLEIKNNEYLIQSYTGKDSMEEIKKEKPSHSNVILFSSGTTGKPKMMKQNLHSIFESIQLPKKQKRLSILLFLLFDHIGGLNTLISSTKNGMRMVLPQSKNTEDVLNAIEKQEVNILPTTPTFINLLFLSESFKTTDFSSLKLITYGTEKMNNDNLLKLKSYLPHVRLLQTFGTSETGILKTVSKSSDSLFFKIIDTDYKIINNELYLRSKTQINKYQNTESKSFTDDGYFKTGDVVEVDNDGFIKIIDRTNNIINVGGLKVFPNEIEQIISSIGYVCEVKVVGMTNSITGNIINAKVVVTDKKLTDKEIKREIRKVCSENLEKFKIPQKITILREIRLTSRFKSGI